MDLQTTWVALSLAFALGARHGLDPDHLIAIDNLTRYNASRRPLLARWCGFFLCDGSRHGCCLRRASFFALRRDNGASLLAGMSRRILYHRCIACAWPSQLV